MRKQTLLFFSAVIVSFTALSQSNSIESGTTDSLMFFTNGAKNMVLTPEGVLRLGDLGGIKPSALLQLNSTDRGFLVPRMTTTDRDNIVSPEPGLIIYNTTTASFDFYDGGAWTKILSSSGGGADAESIQSIPVTTLTPQPGEILWFNGSNWDVGPQDAQYIWGFPVTTITPSDGQVLKYNTGSGEYQLEDMNADYIQGYPVTTLTANPGDVMWFNGSNWDVGPQDAQYIWGFPVTTMTPSDGQVLKYNTGSGQYELESINGDYIQGYPVTTLTANPGEVLWFNGSNWDVGPQDAQYIWGFPVTTMTPSDGQVLKYNTGTGEYTLEDMNADYIQGYPVSTVTANPGEVFTFTGSDWFPVIPDAQTIQGYGVTTMTPADGQVLSYNNGTGGYELTDKNADYIQGYPVTTVTANPGEYLYFTGSDWYPSPADASYIQGTPVSTVTPNPGDVLTYNGGSFQWEPLAGAGGDAPWTKSGTAIYNTTLTDFVGIGTNSPNAGLEIDMGATNTQALQLTSSGAGFGSGLMLENTGGSGRIYSIYSNSGGDLVVGDETAGAGRIQINSGGYVGFGTNAPTSKMTISTNTSNPQTPSNSLVHLVGTDGTTTYQTIDGHGAASGIILRRSNGTAASPSALLSGDEIGKISFQGYGATSYNANTPAKISAQAAENWTDATMAGELTFSTRPSGSTAASVERMKIDKDGNVGIGTNTPAQTLDVAGDAAFEGTDPAVYLMETDGNANENFGIIANGGLLRFNTIDDAYTGNTRMAMDQSGNVGVGVNTPAEAFHVYRNLNSFEGIEVENVNTGTSAAAMMKFTADVAVLNMGVKGSNNSGAAVGAISNADQAYFRTATGNPVSSFVIGTGSAAPLHLFTNDAPALTVDPTGKVGIGTTSPGVMLDVAGKTKTQTFRLTTGAAVNYILQCTDANGNSAWVDPSTLPGDDLGDHTATIDIDANGNNIINVNTPTSASDAATKGYVDGLISSTGDFMADGSVPMTGQFQAANGTAASPSISFASDVNTGFYQPANDNLSIATAGAERLRVDASGNVGVGTSAPVFNWHQASSSQYFSVVQTSSATNYSIIGVGRTAGSVGSESAPGDNQTIGEFMFLGYDGSSFQESAVVHAKTAQAHGPGATGGELYFKTTPIGSTTAQDRMMIDDAGNVGIGTTSPQSPLHILSTKTYTSSADPYGGALIVQGEVGSGAPKVHVVSNGSSKPGLRGYRSKGTIASPSAVLSGETLLQIEATGYGTSNWGTTTNAQIAVLADENFTNTSKGTAIIFETTTNGTEIKTERMRINNAGQVGIGTTTPSATLDVVGDVEIPAANEYTYSSAKTHYKSLGPTHFGHSEASVAYVTASTGAQGSFNNGIGNHSVYAPIDLPDGATIVGIEFDGWDAHGNDQNGASIGYVNGGTYTNISSAGNTLGFAGGVYNASSVANHVVDNQNNAYLIAYWVINNSGTGNLTGINKVKVTYTVDQAD